MDIRQEERFRLLAFTKGRRCFSMALPPEVIQAMESFDERGRLDFIFGLTVGFGKSLTKNFAIRSDPIPKVISCDTSIARQGMHAGQNLNPSWVVVSKIPTDQDIHVLVSGSKIHLICEK